MNSRIGFFMDKILKHFTIPHMNIAKDSKLFKYNYAEKNYNFNNYRTYFLNVIKYISKTDENDPF